jgi:predicted dehydrogenase
MVRTARSSEVDTALPRCIAIAGGWGYIGQRFIQAAHHLGVSISVLDPGPRPDALAGLKIDVFADASRFYASDADLFHLALHPKHRGKAFETLAERATRGDRFLVLCEKPMVDPESPEKGPQLINTLRVKGLHVLYDYLELFDPITRRILDYLGQFQSVSLSHAEMHRSKDRENPDNPRNYKTMVPIQYQETVHCIAWLLNLLGHIEGGLERVWKKGVVVSGNSEVYHPPNPAAYSHEVDGRVDGRMRLGDLDAHIDTNFKSGAALTKRRVLKGVGDGKPFVIEAEYLEGKKFLRINGKDLEMHSNDSTCGHVIRRGWAWHALLTDQDYTSSTQYPTSLFAWYTYLLSSMLWDSCQDAKPVTIDDKHALLYYNPGYAVRKRRSVYADLFDE